MKFLKWIAIAVVSLVVLALVFGKDDAKNTAPTTTGEVKPTDAKPAATEVTATDLVKAYKANEIAANEKFKGKELLVSGTIESIDAGMSDKPTIVLKTGMDYGMNNPRADLADSDMKKAATLKKGQAIKMLCVGNSEMAGTPMLDDCVIQ
jgi:hypothetical protein